MGYDGTIQFDVAMDIAQFKQGINEISFLLANMQLEGMQQRIVEQMNVGALALQAGLNNGIQFSNGFVQGLAGLLINSEGLFGNLFSTIPLQAFQQGQLADAQLALGLYSGQSNLAAFTLANGVISQIRLIIEPVRSIAFETVIGFANQLASGTTNVTMVAKGISNGVVKVFHEMGTLVRTSAAQTVLGISNAFLNGAGAVFSSAKHISQGTARELAQLYSMTADIIPQVINGMAGQMDALAPALYNKASTIASTISAQLRAAFDVQPSSNKPNKPTGGATQNVRSILIDTPKIASGKFADTGTFARGILQEVKAAESTIDFSASMGMAIAENQHTSFTQPYRLQNNKASGGDINLGGLTQNFYSPQAPTPAQATQQGIAFLEQARWKLPQMDR